MDEPPATRQPAPGALSLVQAFVNTAELPGGYDELGDVPATVAWLAARGYQMSPDEGSRRRVVETREHLRALIAANSGRPLLTASAAKLSRLLDQASLHPVVDVRGVRLASTSRAVDGFLAALLAGLVESTIDGTFRRLKVCRSDSCQWTFYDSSKNGCGAWCSMRVCGARAKARAYRERHRGAAGAIADAAPVRAVTRRVRRPHLRHRPT